MLLASVLVAASVVVGADEITLKVSVPPPEFVAAPDGVEAIIEGFTTRAQAPGQPRLPEAILQVVLPPGRAAARVEIEGTSEPLPGTVRLTWGQQPQPIGTAPLPRTAPDPSVYGSDDLYPAQPVALVGTGTLHGVRLASVALRPLQWRPQSGRAVLWRALRVRVTLQPAPSGRADGGVAARGLVADLRELARVAVNPETALAYGAVESGRSADAPWLVVTPERLRPAFDRLVQHRELRGMHAQLLTMEDVRDTYPGRDDAEKLRAAIAAAYRDHGTSYALLGGDDVDDDGAPLLPVRNCPEYDNLVSDYYFGALDGDWDTDADGTFCEGAEVDYFSEVHVGRATVDTLEEANHWIDKLIAFESGLPEERRRDAVFIGENLDGSTWGEDAKQRTAGLVPPEYVIDKRYARNETCSTGFVIESLNRGPHFVNHNGHSGSNYVMLLGIGDVEALVNESPFFGYSIGCYAGAFDQPNSGNGEAISEHFLLAPHAGVGVVMNSRYGWYWVGGYTGLSAELDHEYFDAVFTEGLATMGAANDDSRADLTGTAQSDGTMRYCFLETNLHGDPATPFHVRRAQVVAAGQRVVEDDPVYGNADGGADPLERVQLVVTLRNDGTAAATGVAARLTSSTPGVTVHEDMAHWPDLAPGASADPVRAFSATLDLPCGATAQFRLEVRHDGLTDVSVFPVTVGRITEVEVRADDFEADAGWTTGGTAKTGGRFVRQDPNAVADPFRGAIQPDDDHTEAGSACWVTGNPPVFPGFDPQSGDVNQGNTWIESPVFDGTGDGTLLVRFARWYHRTNVGIGNVSEYRAKVSTNGGTSWTDLERLEVTAPRWTARELDAGVAGRSATMKLRFEATETARYLQNGRPLTELLVDDVTVVRRIAQCTGFTPGGELPPGPVGNTLLVEREGQDVVLRWARPAEDASHGPALFFPAYRSAAPAGGFTRVADPTALDWCDMGQAPAPAGNCFYLVAARNAAGDSGEAPTP